MKISLEWLKEYLPGELEPQQAAEALTHGGLPVELIEKIADDTVIDVEVTSNRGDCLSHLGIARELSALMNRPMKDVRPAANESATAASSLTSVRIDNLDLCPHYTARILRNIKIQPSPAWMVRRLESVGLRPINNVVDVTNYVMFEMGQPLHAFDFDTLAGRQIIVRTARPGERLVSIDGRKRDLDPSMLTIADAQRPVALAGVMGGLDSEVSDKTVNLLLESARFDPLSVRRTARALAMASDASYRFERGIDPTLPARASLRAAQLILETAGGELLAGMAEAGRAGHEPKKLTLRLAKLQQVLGISLPAEGVVDALRRVQLSPVLKGQQVDCTVPSWRRDLNIEVDLVEEVARIVGYEKIPMRDEISIRLTAPDPDRRTIEQARSVLVAGGYYESVTFSFVSDLLAGDFVPTEAASLPRAEARVRSADAHLRPSILPGLLDSVRRNESVGVTSAKLFEMGSTFWSDSAARVVETRRLGMVGSSDVREVRGVVEALLSRLNNDLPLSVVPDERPGFAKGACGRIVWAGKSIGHLGKIDRAVAEKLSLKEIPAAAEIEVDALLANAQHVPQLHPLPRFPAVRRDLSLVVDESVRYERIEALVRDLKLESLEGLEYVTTYRGKPLEPGKKSVTITLVFRSPAATLTSEQVETPVQQAIAAAQDKLGATIRG